MIDSFSLLLTHALIMLAAWRLLSRTDLDREEHENEPRRRWGRPKGDR